MPHRQWQSSDRGGARLEQAGVRVQAVHGQAVHTLRLSSRRRVDGMGGASGAQQQALAWHPWLGGGASPAARCSSPQPPCPGRRRHLRPLPQHTHPQQQGSRPTWGSMVYRLRRYR